MVRNRNYLRLVAVLIVAALLGAPTQTQAAFEITLAPTGGPAVVIADNSANDLDNTVGTISVNQVFGNIEVRAKITGVSNNQFDDFGNPAPFPVARLTETAISVRNTGTVGVGTLDVFLSATNYLGPDGTPLEMSSSASATASAFSIPAGDVITFQSYIDDANNLYGGSANGPAGTSFTTGPQTSASVSVGVGGTLDVGFTPGTSVAVVPASQPFSLTESTRFVLSAGANVTFTGQTAVSVPAPGGLVLATAALPCLLGFWRRRQQVKAQTV